MTCRTWWIMASIAFLVGMIMGGIGMFIGNDVTAAVLILLNWGFAIAGWVLWAIGLVSYFRWR